MPSCSTNLLVFIFSSAVALLFNWKYFLGLKSHADDMRMMCRWHESEILGEISLKDDICHLHVVCMSSARHADDVCRSSTQCAGDVWITCGWRADDKRQQLCIKPTGFLVITIVTEKGRSLEHAVIFLRNGIPENFNDVQKTMILFTWCLFGRILEEFYLV